MSNSEDTDGSLGVIDPFAAVTGGRLGPMLRATRERNNLSLDALAARSDGIFDAQQLQLFERAELKLTPAARVQLADLYNIDLAPLADDRTRVVIDLDSEEVRIGVVSRSFHRELGADEVLRSYLTLVSDLRSVPTRFVTLRNDDIAALADGLHLEAETILSRLARLMKANATELATMRRLFLAGAAIVASLALFLVDGSHASQPPQTSIQTTSTASGQRADGKVDLVRVATGDLGAISGVQIDMPVVVTRQDVAAVGENAVVIERSGQIEISAKTVER